MLPSSILHSSSQHYDQLRSLRQKNYSRDIPAPDKVISLDLLQEPTLLESLDLHSLPSPMSPDPSLKDRLSESIKEDEEDADEYDIFTTPSGTRNQQSSLQQSWNQQLTFQQQQQQQQYEYYRQLREYQQQQPREYQQPPPSEKPMTPLRILRPHHPMVLQRTVSMPHYPTLHTFYQQSKQTHSHIPPQTQRQCAANSSQTPFPASSEYGQHSMTSIPQYTPNSPPYHVPGAERFVPLPEQFSDLATLDHYLSTLQTQRPILQNTIPVLDQDMDLMMLSSLTLAIQDDSNHMNQLNTSGSSSVHSPSLSWASGSPSRDTSPNLSPSLVRRQISASLPSSSVGSPLIIDSSQTSFTATNERDATQSSTATATPTSPVSRRRRRVRPATAKKVKKIKPTSFPCMASGCDKVFSRAYNLTSHMKTHSSEKPFLCGVCPLAFARRHDRERHIRLHTGEKPYSCEICGAGFMRNDALHRHQKLCGVAGSSFATDFYGDSRWRDEDSGQDSHSGMQDKM